MGKLTEKSKRLEWANKRHVVVAEDVFFDKKENEFYHICSSNKEDIEKHEGRIAVGGIIKKEEDGGFCCWLCHEKITDKRLPLVQKMMTFTSAT